jgi:hypothetical protein
VTVEEIDAALDRVESKLTAISEELPPAESMVLARLLTAVRAHPLIGEQADPAAVETANNHIPDEAKRSRERGYAIGDVVLCTANKRWGSATASGETQETGRALAQSLVSLLAEMDTVERVQCRELLSNALGGLSPSGSVPVHGWRAAAWIAVLGVLTTTGRCGATFLDRESILDQARFAALVSEAGIRYWFGVRMGMRMTAPSGPVAQAFGTDPELCRLVERAVGTGVLPGNGVTSGDNATYLFYDVQGDGIQPHIDPFGLTNVLVMLERIPPSDGSEGSALILYQPGQDPTRLSLRPGDVIVLMGAGSVHCREPLGPGERVTMLSLVFH